MQDSERGKLAIPTPARRLKQVRVNVRDLAVAKTNNLQPYPFRVLQQQDAVAEVQLGAAAHSVRVADGPRHPLSAVSAVNNGNEGQHIGAHDLGGDEHLTNPDWPSRARLPLV